ncbi:methylated-DNA-[protein]-cysteine S-methyltransferase [Arthrobacter subterraneus]|uniref:Methylated-DNA-[protein]-cysteine S-methyltransferase n=1 Tax=Arthrobacter subterraneus TaxID=335973 RepID=A0A1G8G8K5_9MICC|nr:methylated-DNA--[protein]-cysteine S-methyltransferase [Arthrobacter subterraneus]SDH90717.1 methylated-DNA-[protein]-cysteine S-methyltransferase [Arthrobacter subterraneus]
MTTRTATMSTPDGPFTVVERDGVVLASGWTADLAEVTGQIHPSLRAESVQQVAGLGAITDAVCAYYDGDLAAIESVPVRQLSGPFRNHAWEVLRTVAPGRPVTYLEYARLAGHPAAVRAAAGACAFNAAALFVPCHRVIRTDGSLGGFRWGLEVKTNLLAREKAAASPDGQSERVAR